LPHHRFSEEKAMDDNLYLEERINAFNLLRSHGLSLTDMGASQLIRDLWNEVQWLRFQIENLSKAHGVKKALDEMIAAQSQSPGRRA